MCLQRVSFVSVAEYPVIRAEYDKLGWKCSTLLGWIGGSTSGSKLFLGQCILMSITPCSFSVKWKYISAVHLINPLKLVDLMSIWYLLGNHLVFPWYLFDFCFRPSGGDKRFLPLVRYCRSAFYHRCLSQTADANNVAHTHSQNQPCSNPNPGSNMFPNPFLIQIHLLVEVWPWTRSEHICRRLNLKWTLRPTLKWRLLELVYNLNYYTMEVNYQMFPRLQTVHDRIKRSF